MGKEKNSPFFFTTFFFIQTFSFFYSIFSNPNFHDRGKKTAGLLQLEAKIFSGILISSLNSHHGAISGEEKKGIYFLLSNFYSSAFKGFFFTLGIQKAILEL